ncbi:hypothetical protein C2S51_036737 [Perilla frutescens var. frutescens]|nr:hypothetical protein C2S51_036737 [Perilla frutescens var. frutescens]
MPKNRAEWEAGNWTSGCIRKTQLQCEQNNSMGEPDEFLKVEKVKIPDHFKWLPSLKGNCRDTCWSDCSCIAYANPSGIGCLHWTRNLTDAQVFSTYGGDDLYIRLAFSELPQKKNDHKTIIATTVVLGFILVAVSACFFNYRARKHKNSLISLKTKGTDAEYSEESMLKRDKHGVKLEELSLFKFQMLSNVTGNFDPVHKLGQGGFGPVYRLHFEQAWKLWNDGKIVSLMDPRIYNGGMEGDTVRYSNVGLLCVQETTADRPNISTVLSMLNCEIVNLPRPNQPAFLRMQMSPITQPSNKASANNVSISQVEGR